MFKIESLFKKVINAETKNYRSISSLPLLSKVLEKQFTIKPRIIFKEMNYSTVNNYNLEQINTQICVSQLGDMIVSGDKNKLHTGMILIDF